MAVKVIWEFVAIVESSSMIFASSEWMTLCVALDERLHYLMYRRAQLLYSNYFK